MGTRLLIVDDNTLNRDLLREVLEYLGFEVIEAADGREGVKLARRHLPALIFMDIQMPAMDGITAGRVLKEDPATSWIKIIALTSFALSGDRDGILDAGFDDYLSKPVEIRELPERIICWLGDREYQTDTGD